MLFLDVLARISLYFSFVVLFTHLKIILAKEKKEILFLETFYFFFKDRNGCITLSLKSVLTAYYPLVQMQCQKRLYWDVFKPLD